MQRKKRSIGQRVLHSTANSIEIFSFIAPYHELISKYQNLNKRFYDVNLPTFERKVVLFHAPENRLSISVYDDVTLFVSQYDTRRRRMSQKSHTFDGITIEDTC